MARAFILTEGVALEGSVLCRLVQEKSFELSNLTVMTGCDEASLASLESGAYDGGVLLASSARITSTSLAQLGKALRPGCSLTVQLQEGTRADEIRQTCILAGFVVPEIVGKVLQIIVQKPNWEIGAKRPITLKRPNAEANGGKSSASKKQVWSVVLEDDELMEEDDLLTEDDLKPVAPTGNDRSQAKPVRKACKDCSCGRADAEAQGVSVKLTQEMLDNPQSACGSCGLGDAFRCTGCPYRGLPTFEMGKKIELPSDFLIDA